MDTMLNIKLYKFGKVQAILLFLCWILEEILWLVDISSESYWIQITVNNNKKFYNRYSYYSYNLGHI